jgi:hypothetical protein
MTGELKERRNILFTIGLDKYESDVWKDLKNAVLDCTELKKTLENHYSFEEYPNSLFNSQATKKEIYNNLNTLKSFIEPDDNLIIFFAGHGSMNPVTNRGYWIPYEGTSDTSTWIENSVIKDFIQDIIAHHIWLIADSCFSGTFLTNTRDKTIELSYEKLDAKKSRWMLSSGSEEKVSDGIPTKHSPFCNYLLKYLNNNSNKFTSVSEIITYVKSLTENNSNQTPRGAFIDNVGHAEGEMILTLKEEFVQHNIKTTRGKPNTPNLRIELANFEKTKNKISVGKEILLIDSFVDGQDYLILENFRFNDEGNKKLKFKDDKVILKTKDGEDFWKLIRRFATWQGLTRYTEENEIYFRDNKGVIVNAHTDIEKEENKLYCIAHADYLQELIEFNKDLMSCLHCGEKISTNNSYLVEIDEIGFKDNVGNVHKECLRTSDRILGKAGYENLKDSSLINFDYKLWCDLLEKGQGQIQAIYSKYKKHKIAIISWNPENNINTGKYCIRTFYENGDSDFMKLGKEIHRFKSSEIDSEIEHFNSQLDAQREKNDLPSIIAETKIFGFYQYLLKLKEPNQTIIKVSHYEKAIYSNQLEEHITDFDNDYTPIGLLRSIETEEIFTIGDLVPLLTNPIKIDEYLENWKEVIGDFESQTIQIIKSDYELDTYIQSILNNNLQPIINPLFNLEQKELEIGLIIKNMKTIIEESRNEME